MKILRTDNSFSELFRHSHHSFRDRLKKKNKSSEFKKIFEQTWNEQCEDLEEFRVLLPKHGQFWDNGYEDLGKEVL